MGLKRPALRPVRRQTAISLRRPCGSSALEFRLPRPCGSVVQQVGLPALRIRCAPSRPGASAPQLDCSISRLDAVLLHPRCPAAQQIRRVPATAPSSSVGLEGVFKGRQAFVRSVEEAGAGVRRARIDRRRTRKYGAPGSSVGGDALEPGTASPRAAGIKRPFKGGACWQRWDALALWHL